MKSIGLPDDYKSNWEKIEDMERFAVPGGWIYRPRYNNSWAVFVPNCKEDTDEEKLS